MSSQNISVYCRLSCVGGEVQNCLTLSQAAEGDLKKMRLVPSSTPARPFFQMPMLILTADAAGRLLSAEC